MAKIVKKPATKAQPHRPALKTPPPRQEVARVPPKGQQAVARAGMASAPGYLATRAGDAGKGKSGNQEDNLVPMIAVVQDKTPVADRESPDFREGVVGGMIWLKGIDEFIPGEEGILVQPCWFDKDFVEWKPNRGGFVGRHRKMPDDAERLVDPRDPNKFYFIRKKNQNEIVETRYHIVRVWMDDGRKIPYVIPLSSTGHTVSKAWMFDMNNQGEAASFAMLYRLKTGSKSNAKGTWFKFEYEFEGWVEDENEYMAGFTLNSAFDKGESRMDERQMERGGEDSDQGM